jgi:hypothetical protein
MTFSQFVRFNNEYDLRINHKPTVYVQEVIWWFD